MIVWHKIILSQLLSVGATQGDVSLILYKADGVMGGDWGRILVMEQVIE